MILFDILDKLENYSQIIPHMDRVIDTMDHSKPYEDRPGRYPLSPDGEIFYLVSVHLSSEAGFPGEKWKGRLVMEICLEGDEIVSAGGSVFRLAPGRFLVYEGDETVKRGIASSLPVCFKTVRFIL